MDYHTSQSSGVCSDKSLSIFIDNKELILNKRSWEKLIRRNGALMNSQGIESTRITSDSLKHSTSIDMKSFE